jgi:hypothetical protein
VPAQQLPSNQLCLVLAAWCAVVFKLHSQLSLQGNSMGYPPSAHMQRSQLHGGGPAGGVKRRADADPFGGSHEPMKQQRVQQPYTAQVGCTVRHVAGAVRTALRVAAQGTASAGQTMAFANAWLW